MILSKKEFVIKLGKSATKDDIDLLIKLYPNAVLIKS